MMVEILAVMASPIVAFLVAHLVSDRKERLKRRYDVFISLWLTRGHLGSYGRLNPEHVRALNMIAIEFSPAWFDFGREEDLQAVVDLWHRYRASMYLPQSPENWMTRDEFLIQLHLAMALVLRLNLDREEVTNPYAPEGYQTNDLKNGAIRDAALELVQGNRALHVTTATPAVIVNSPATPNNEPSSQPLSIELPQPEE